MKPEVPAWKALEIFVAEFHEELLPAAKVTHNADLFGAKSETDRQIDGLIERAIRLARTPSRRPPRRWLNPTRMGHALSGA